MKKVLAIVVGLMIFGAGCGDSNETPQAAGETVVAKPSAERAKAFSTKLEGTWYSECAPAADGLKTDTYYILSADGTLSVQTNSYTSDNCTTGMTMESDRAGKFEVVELTTNNATGALEIALEEQLEGLPHALKVRVTPTTGKSLTAKRLSGKALNDGKVVNLGEGKEEKLTKLEN